MVLIINCKWFQTLPPPESTVRQVYGIVFSRDGRIFCQNDNGRYNLPGGKPENEETTLATLKRECLEESQLTYSNPVYLGYVNVTEITNKHSITYVQLRYIALIDKLYPNALDPATQRQYGRILVPPMKLITLLNWGTHGDNQIKDAINLAYKTYGVKLLTNETTIIPDDGRYVF